MSELVEIGRITVGVRRRDDLGDLTGLMDSLRRVSLIHPIVVADDYTLIAGHRRLEAAKQLGWQTIEVRMWKDLSEEQRREIELEENLHRKDLTPAEHSKTLADLASAVKKRLLENHSARVAQGTEGHPSDANGMAHGNRWRPDAKAKVAAEMGISISTLSMAERHLRALERYPELGAAEVSQAAAVHQAAEWDAMRAKQRTWARKKWAKAREVVKGQAPADPEATPAPQTCVAKPPKPKARKRRRRPTPTVAMPPTRQWYYFSAGLLQVITDFERNGGVAALLTVWTEAGRRQAGQEIAARLEQLQRIEGEIHAGQPTGPLRLLGGCS
jgi:ParB family transcriptional regulator, chromosome partitioning protein